MPEVRPLDASVCERADLLDLGTGTGEWLEQAARRLGVEHPIGIDLNRSKVAQAQARGLSVYQADFTELDPVSFPAVKVASFDNVLEHLPSLNAVEAIFEQACAIASHVVYIRHPSFEDEDYLAALGLKQYWTDWPGVHTTHVRLHEFVAMAARHGVYNFTVTPLKRAFDSDDPTILPASAPPNQRKPVRGPGSYGVYDATRYEPKPRVAFDRPVYFAFDMFFFLRSDAPSVHYRADTETAVARPFLEWSTGSDDRRVQARSGRRQLRRLVRRR
jgi:hypothetical protein